jgi:hypothetical protein
LEEPVVFIFNVEDGGSRFLWKVDTCLTNYMVLHLKRVIGNCKCVYDTSLQEKKNHIPASSNSLVTTVNLASSFIFLPSVSRFYECCADLVFYFRLIGNM